MNVTRIRNALARRMQRLKALIIPPPERPDYVRATHYFGDGWALNFLQIVDSASLKRDMAQIVEDGFNTVILVIPWRGLQTDHMVPAYDAFYLSQLKRCLAAADKAGAFGDRAAVLCTPDSRQAAPEWPDGDSAFAHRSRDTGRRGSTTSSACIRCATVTVVSGRPSSAGKSFGIRSGAGSCIRQSIERSWPKKSGTTGSLIARGS